VGRYVVGVTGASGALYARRLVATLVRGGHRVDLVVSAAGFRVLAHELDWDDPRYEGPGGLEARCRRFFLAPEGDAGPAAERLRLHPIRDVAGPLASGSTPTDGMVVVPCTMGRIGAFASGRSQDLLDRCADVALKEGRPLVLVPRETPLSLVHLRNLTALAEAGAVILPAMPGFYHHPRTVQDVADFVVAKVLARLGLTELAQALLPPWPGLPDAR
jgi:4-hydroxy-3-polyprenylbenzoate decarboxylase